MEAKPHLPAAPERMVIALWRGEKRAAHRRVPEEGEEIQPLQTPAMMSDMLMEEYFLTE